MSIFEKYIMAHLVGDYLLQNNWMALGKSKSETPLVVHSAIYGLTFGVIFLNPLVALGIFILHYFFDKSYGGGSPTEWWLRFIRGRSLKSTQDIPSAMLCSQQATACSLYISFSAVVYAVVDFILHFLVQYPALVDILEHYNLGWRWFE
jgi:hypothetical protein